MKQGLEDEGTKASWSGKWLEEKRMYKTQIFFENPYDS